MNDSVRLEEEEDARHTALLKEIKELEGLGLGGRREVLEGRLKSLERAEEDEELPDVGAAVDRLEGVVSNALGQVRVMLAVRPSDFQTIRAHLESLEHLLASATPTPPSLAPSLHSRTSHLSLIDAQISYYSNRARKEADPDEVLRLKSQLQNLEHQREVTSNEIRNLEERAGRAV